MKKGIIAGSSILIFIAIYNVLVFCLVNNFTKNFWTGYIFIMIAFVIMLASFVISMRRGKIVGLPLTTISLYYVVAEIILGSLLMYFNISWLAVFLPQIILFLIFLMVFIPAILRYFTKEETKQENKQSE